MRIKSQGTTLTCSHKGKLCLAIVVWVHICLGLFSLHSTLMRSATEESVLQDGSNQASTTTTTPPNNQVAANPLPGIGDLLPIDGSTRVHELLPKLMLRLNHDKPGRLVDFGAGVRDDDPMFPFMDAGWEGLLVDGDPDQRAKMHQRFPYDDRAHVAIEYILADTISELLSKHGFDKHVDMFKIDIDSFDCYVMHTVLQVVRPKVVIMEVNVKFPPHVRMALYPGYEPRKESEGGTTWTQIPFDSEQRGHVYGCSLAYQVQDLMKPNGYELLHMDWNNAIYIDTRSVTGFNVDTNNTKSWHDMYNAGYWKRKRRDLVFGFNREVVPWNKKTVEEIFAAVQVLFRTDSSHANHHLYFARSSVEREDDLEHACFDSEGVLELASQSKGCTAQMVKQRL